MTACRTVKTVSLAFMIVLGLIAQATTSHARQLETLTVADGYLWCDEVNFE